MRVLITGGSGTVGTAFIREFRDQHQFAIFSRGEKLQWEAKQEFPEIESYLGAIEDLPALLTAYAKFMPDCVIHAAAIKHIDLAEKQPIQTCKVNILGSLNVINASVTCGTPITVGISTDKACNPSFYGSSKYLMERCFLEANNKTTRFAACRFGNVARSNGSVIPKWQAAAARGEHLTITDPNMCRLMISQPDAARLVAKAIDLCRETDLFPDSFVLTKQLKAVNIMDLARAISPRFTVVGARPGETLHEAMISAAEVPRTQVLSCGYVKIQNHDNADEHTRWRAGYDSATAERMSEQEIRELIAA